MILEIKRAVLLTLIGLLVACERQSPEPAGVVEVPPPAVSAGVLEPCNLLAEFAARIPATTIERSLGKFEDEFTGSTKEGCLLKIGGSFKALENQNPADTQVHAFATSQGWQDDNTHSADGPDGTVFAFWTPAAWCLVRGSWDGGDDSDPTVVPDDHYELTIGCTPRL